MQIFVCGGVACRFLFVFLSNQYGFLLLLGDIKVTREMKYLDFVDLRHSTYLFAFCKVVAGLRHIFCVFLL